MPDPTDPKLAALLAGLRTVVAAAGPFLVAKGWLSADSLPGLLALVTSAVTFGYGVYRTHQRQVVLVKKG